METSEKEYINEIIEAIMRVARGDYSVQVKLSGKNDALDSLAMGVNMMVDDLKTNTIGFAYVNKRIQDILDVIQSVARGNFTAACEISEKNDAFDALAIGINMMIDDIRNSYEELQATQDASLNIMEDLDRRGKELSALNEQLQEEIIERKRAEDELISSEERLRMLFEYAPDPFYLMDTEGSFVDGNKAAEEAVGFRKEEIIGKNMLDLNLLLPEQIEKAMELLAKNIEGKPTGPDEFTLNRKDGKKVDVEIRTFPVKIKGLDLVLGIAHDITERKKMEDELRNTLGELEKRNKELDNFVFAVSHDLKAPLVTIQGFANLLIMKHGDKLNETAVHYIDIIISGVKDLNMLVTDLLALSRAKRTKWKVKNVNLSDVIKSSLKSLHAIVTEKEAKVSIPKELPTVSYDPTQLNEVFTNLLVNAIKYSKPNQKPNIEIEWGENKNENIISVKDNGKGIEEKYLDRIFEPFERIAQDQKGTGIGLSIVKNIVERHGGRIWVESKFGEGSTFYFTIPKEVK